MGDIIVLKQNDGIEGFYQGCRVFAACFTIVRSEGALSKLWVQNLRPP